MCIRHSIAKIGLTAFVLGAGVWVAAFPVPTTASSPAQEKPKTPTAISPRATPPSATTPRNAAIQKSLFDRLGGTYAIAAMVDDYIDNLVKDPIVMANPQVKGAVERAAAAHGVPGLKYQITAFVIEGAGGPYKYHGRNMQETHKTLGITQGEWDASAAVFKRTLAKFSVPTTEQDEIFAIINNSHDDIVVNGTGGQTDQPHGR